MNTMHIITIVITVAFFLWACWYTNKALIEKRQELKKMIRKRYIITRPKDFRYWVEIKSLSELNDELDRFLNSDPLPEHIARFLRLKPAP